MQATQEERKKRRRACVVHNERDDFVLMALAMDLSHKINPILRAGPHSDR